MIDRNRYESLADALASVDDLGEVGRALVREGAIRQVMRETGEDRKTVTDMIDAMDSMGQEAVLDLTEGEPTTLADALQRYVDTLEQAASEDKTVKAEDVCGALHSLLAYPWPGVPDAEALTREIHESYIRAAPRFGVEVTAWDELEPYQRDLALAVVNDLMARGVLSKRGGSEEEAVWRSRLAQEVYQHADRIEREPETRSLGVALASVVRHVGDQIGRMP